MPHSEEDLLAQMIIDAEIWKKARRLWYWGDPDPDELEEDSHKTGHRKER